MFENLIQHSFNKVSGNTSINFSEIMKVKPENNVDEKREIKGELAFQKIENYVSDLKEPFQKSDVIKCYYKYPLKLMLPKHAAENACQWVYPIIFGGGLVGGDEVSIDTKVGDTCSVLMTSQSFPKVYANGGKGPCVQKLNFSVGDGSFLAVLSDPVVCFKDAVFHQEQKVHLSKSSNLIYLDWFTAGRTARGENWAFEKLHTSLSIFIEDELILREALELSNTPELLIKDTMGNFTVVGVCVVLGPYVQKMSENIVIELNKRKGCGEKISKDVLFTASPLSKLKNNKTAAKSLGCIIRIGATTTSLAYKELDKLLQPIQHVFGGNPFESKY